MPIQTRYLFTAAMDVEPTREALFNEIYDGEHVPLILKVPGVVAAARFKRQELTMVIGGERKTIVVEHEPLYNALYEIEDRKSTRLNSSHGYISYAVFCLKKKKKNKKILKQYRTIRIV